MRCLTLADRLRDTGASVLFICRNLPGNLCDLIDRNGYRVCRLAGDLPSQGDPDRDRDARHTRDIMAAENVSDWLIVDHYGLDISWETALRPHVRALMVIDDLADRRHDCHLLLDQNLHEDMESRYTGLVPGDCRMLLGPAYALLRPEFLRARKRGRLRDGRIERILVFLGSGDPDNVTAMAVEALEKLHRPDIAVDVVIGTVNPHREQVAERCRSLPNCTCHYSVESMAELMAAADLVVGAGGTSSWERCCLGLPAIVIQIADNQRAATEALAPQNAIWNLGWHEDVTADDIQHHIEDALNRPDGVRAMGAAAAAIMDDSGGAERVVEVMLETIHVGR